ncbi:phosphoribosyltransferase [Candidatus Bathyarchaeota archaeon]|nr:phosphoribosyltransferase [Candidatus Bathyarchaeota archaeon]
MVSELGFEVPTWNDIYNMLIDLADKVRVKNFKPDILVGISRGGWLPTRVLSDLLENPSITSVGAAFYVGIYETENEPVLTQPLSISAFDKKILLVDDVVDTGKSAMLIRSLIDREGAKEIKLLTIYYKPWSIVRPDFYSKETSDWIVFPWEIKETLRKLKEKWKGKTELFMEATSRLVKSGVSKELIERLLKEIS